MTGRGEGLRRLQALWPARLHVLAYGGVRFWQEACASVLVELSQAASPDWLYVFDADEFLLVDEEAGSLGQVLENIDDGCSRVRYEVQNWVSLSNFDDRLVGELPTVTLAIHHQCVPGPAGRRVR